MSLGSGSGISGRWNELDDLMPYVETHSIIRDTVSTVTNGYGTYPRVF
jgi:hypothetical protein